LKNFKLTQIYESSKIPREVSVREVVSGRKVVDIKVDTGADVTLVGCEDATLLGVTKESIRTSPVLSFYGSAGRGYASQVFVGSVKMKDKTLQIQHIYVPFSLTKTKEGWERKYTNRKKSLLGMDLMSLYDVKISRTIQQTTLEFNRNFQTESSLEPIRTYTLQQLVKALDQTATRVEEVTLDQSL